MQNKIKLYATYIEVQCDKSDTDTKNKLCSFYPLHHNRLSTSFQLSTRLLPEILKLFRPNWATEAPDAIKDAVHEEMLARSKMSDLLTNGPRQQCIVNDRLTLMRHQQLGREIAKVRNRFGFFYDTRTGKTPLALSIIYDSIVGNPSEKWLVVCPLILIKEAWLGDAEKFFPGLTIINCHAATPSQRYAQMAKQGNIYVTNTESFITYRQHFDTMGFTGCFVDESSDMKSNKSKVSKELVSFAQTIKRFYLLSGTPAPNGEWEYYMQLQAIDMCSVPQSYTQFKERYFTNVSFNPQYEKLTLRPDRAAELFTQIKKYALYVDKEDVLDTPGRTFNEIELILPPELKKHYSQLRQSLYLELNDAVITAPSAAAKLNKLNQLTSGFVIDTAAIKYNQLIKVQGNSTKESLQAEWHLLSMYRFEALCKLLNTTCAGEQVIIWCNYKKEFETIKSIMDDNYLIGRAGYVYGDVSLSDKEKAIRDFKAGNLQYLVANPASADKGLTLTNCHIAVYFSLNWSYELYKQSTERIYGDKRSQPLHCQYYIFIAKGTIDKILYHEVLQGKKLASDIILNHLKADEYADKDTNDTKY